MDAVRRPQHSSLPGVSSWGWETLQSAGWGPRGLALGRQDGPSLSHRTAHAWGHSHAERLSQLHVLGLRIFVLTTDSVLSLPRSLPRLFLYSTSSKQPTIPYGNGLLYVLCSPQGQVHTGLNTLYIHNIFS